jgi:translocation and assembly module TamA
LLRFVASLCLFLAVGVFATPAALALELFGVTLFETTADADAAAIIADPLDYEITIEMANEVGDIEAAVQNASSLWAGRDGPASGAAGLLALARGDYRRVTAALFTRGHYGGAVSIAVNGREVANLPPDASVARPAAIVIHVDPGPLFAFGQTEIVNAAPPATSSDDWVDPLSSIGFAPGEPALSPVVRRAETLALEAWRQQGFALAEITDRKVVADHPSATLDVVLTVSPGPKTYIGEISISGLEALDREFIRRQSGLVPGQEYDPDDITRARDRMSRLQVFRSVQVRTADRAGPNGELPVTITTQEQLPRRIGVGASFDTTDGFGIEGFWLHRNLFGQAERLRLDAKIAGIGFPLNTAAFDYAFGGTFTKPGIWTPDTDLVAAVSAERTVLTNFTELSAQGRIGLTHQFTDSISGESMLVFERARFSDGFGVRDFATALLNTQATYDTRDNTLDPTEGLYISMAGAPFYEFMFSNPGLRASAEARGYLGLGDGNRFVLAGRVKAGVVFGPTLAQTPPDQLFFAGGGGSVRGYGFKSIGVTGPGGVVSGGRYLLEASVEARARVTDEFGIVAFLDSGYVAATTFPSINNLQLGAGIGLRYFTGLGPIRLDVAFPLNPRPGDPGYAIYAGIGQAY